MRWLESAITSVAPRYAAKRARARLAIEATRKYDGASGGRRTEHWLTSQVSANEEIATSINNLRDRSRNLVANNPYANRGVSVITNNIVGRGIIGQFRDVTGAPIADLNMLYKRWANSTACDVQGLNQFAGIQRLASRTVVESGACLVLRKRGPTLSDLPPLSLLVLEPDYLDTSKDGALSNGGRITGGREFDADQRCVAYYLFEKHPGDEQSNSTRIDASEVLYIYRIDRPGQDVGVPWLAPVMLRLRDYDEFEDAFLFRQKIANCHAAFIYDADPDNNYDADVNEKLEPGAIEILPPGKDIKFNNPPTASGSEDFRRYSITSIAAGLGITYEAISADYSNVNFSSGRMGHIEQGRNVQSWQWQMMIPQLCDGVARWFIESAGVQNGGNLDGISASWTPPRREMVDPAKEIPPIRDAVRSMLMTPQEAARQLGYDPMELYTEWAEAASTWDQLGLVSDTDPRWIKGEKPTDESATDDE